jgi:acetyl-CoA carboxylase biotin carboxyl carrier protein
MELTHDDVLHILELLEASSVDYLEVQLGDTRLVASKSGVLPGSSAAAAAPAAAASTPAPAGQAEAGDTATAVEDELGAAAEEGLVTVTAPVVGVFYAASEPGAEPFVELGGRVEVDTTVGLVEVMKMFNSVTAGVAGEVVRILVSNEEFVEYAQPLFLVRPEQGA